jgi:hypothetical protein
MSNNSEKLRELARDDCDNSDLFREVADCLDELETTKDTLERWRTPPGMVEF